MERGHRRRRVVHRATQVRHEVDLIPGGDSLGIGCAITAALGVVDQRRDVVIEDAVEHGQHPVRKGVIGSKRGKDAAEPPPHRSQHLDRHHRIQRPRHAGWENRSGRQPQQLRARDLEQPAGPIALVEDNRLPVVVDPVVVVADHARGVQGGHAGDLDESVGFEDHSVGEEEDVGEAAKFQAAVERPLPVGRHGERLLGADVGHRRRVKPGAMTLQLLRLGRVGGVVRHQDQGRHPLPKHRGDGRLGKAGPVAGWDDDQDAVHSRPRYNAKAGAFPRSYSRR